MKPIWIILLLSGLGWSACGPTQAPEQARTAALSAADSLQLHTTADSLIALADTAKQGKDLLLLQAADLYKTLREQKAWVKTQRSLFGYYRKDGNYQAAFEKLDQAVREIWWEADTEVGQLYILLGFTLRRLGRNYAASIYYEKARAISDQFGGVTRSNPAGPIYKTLANIKTRLGENEEAIKLLQAGLDLLERDTAQAAWLDNQITRAEIYDDLGIAFQNSNQLPQALEQYEAGLAVLRSLKQVPEKNQNELANTKGLLLSNKASVFFLIGAMAEAGSSVKAALHALPPDKTNYRFSALNIQAEIETANGQDEAARQSRQLALELAADSSENRVERREVAKLLNAIGWSDYHRRNFQSALQYAQKALHLIYPGVSPNDYQQNPKPTLLDPDPENTTAEALDLKGEAAWQLSENDNTKLFMPLALETTGLAIQMMTKLRNVAVYESSKLNSTQISRQLFSRMLRMEYAQKLAGSKSAAKNAFVYAEQSKAVLLQQKITADAARSAAGVADSLIRQEGDLKEQLAYLRNEIFEQKITADSSKTAVIQNLERRLYQVEQQLFRLQNRINEEYQLASRAGDGDVPMPKDLQEKLLRKKEVWVEYFTDPDSNLIYLIAVDEKGLRFECRPYNETEIRNFIQLFNNAVQAENRSGDPALFAEFTQAAYRLYQNLIAPAFSGAIPERLTLAPDGVLALLPFDVLLSELPFAGAPVDYAALPFLLTQSQIRVAPSAALDLFYSKQAHTKRRGPYVGFAPDYSNSVLGQVKSGAEVVQAAAKAFEGEAFIGPQARLDSFLHKAAGHAIIHFHGHAETSDSLPDYSWLAFTAGQPIAGRLLPPSPIQTLGANPGQLPVHELANCLFAHQVYNSHLNADLVLLSACQTGLGKIAPGEGTLSLSRAFQAAGCPATVMSLWEVRDDATAKLMRLFLENIRQGQDKDEALTKAKRSYLKSTGDAFPYYWAGFVLTGKADPVRLAAPWWEGWLGWVLLLGGLVLVVAFVLKRKKLTLFTPPVRAQP